MATHFTRILTARQIETCRAMLEDCAGRPIEIDFTADNFAVFAPDGDMVFAGLKKFTNEDAFVCRLHREVFAP